MGDSGDLGSGDGHDGGGDMGVAATGHIATGSLHRHLLLAGDEARQRAQQEAQVEAASLVEKARQEIQRERDEVAGELRQEFADLTVAAAEKVIEKSLDKEAHRELIEKVLKESTTLDKDKR